MDSQFKIYSKEDGIIHVKFNSSENVLKAFSENLMVDVQLGKKDSFTESLAVNELADMIRRLMQDDIVSIPIPKHFILLESQSIYEETYTYYPFLGGGIYPCNNEYLYMSQRFEEAVSKSNLMKLPIKIEKCVIDSYKKSSCNYIVKNKRGAEFVVPYWILEVRDYLSNPLLHMSPFKRYIEDLPEDLKFAKLGETGYEILFLTKDVGVSYTIYVRNNKGVIYKTTVAYAMLKNMSMYLKTAKLLKGLHSLSPEGSYLRYVVDILRHIDVIYK